MLQQNNYLLIGLGGTGCAVVRELKKKLYVEWRSRGNKGRYPDVYVFDGKHGEDKVESRIATLSIDSNEADLSGQGELSSGWRVFGETLSLRGAEKVLISPKGLDSILASMDRYPGIAPWLRDEKGFLDDIIKGTTEPKGCNQIRRMGRLVLANSSNINTILAKISNRLNALSLNGKVGAEIHIVLTLAAGTGSGCVVDVVAQLQRELRDAPGEHNVFIHGFATMSDVKSANVGKFYPNQYAALMELNAFRVGRYEPWDISLKEPEISKRLAVPKSNDEAPTGDLKDTFKSVALITDTTAGEVNVPLEQQIENVAEFIFQIAVRQMGDLPKELRDAITLEDRSPYPTEPRDGDRSTSFIGYGVQRVSIPEREIREKLSYSFARQFLLKTLYHNWDKGYRDIPRNFSRDAFVNKRRQIWKVIKGHLYLDLVESITGEPEFETYETEWRNTLNREADAIQKQLGDTYEGRKLWLSEFDTRAKEVWEEGFRRRGHTGGVFSYFNIRKEPNEIDTRARDIRGIIERDLIWGFERMDPGYALHHLPGAIKFLRARIEEDRLSFGPLMEKAVEEYKKANLTRSEIRKDYEMCGRWARGKQERLFRMYLETSLAYYYWSTIEQAAKYGQEFGLSLDEKLKGLYEDLSFFDTRIKLLNENTNIEISNRIREDGNIASRDDVEYVVDTKHINKTILTRFEGNKELQDLHSNISMNELKALRGDRVEFSAYLEKMPVDANNLVGGDFEDQLYQVSEYNAVEAHRSVSQDDKNFENILGQNIMRKLFYDNGGKVGTELTHWIGTLLGKAMPMVSFDPNPESMGLDTDGPVLRRCVFVPKWNDSNNQAQATQFQADLKATIMSIDSSGGNCELVETHYEEVPEDWNPTEITVISVAFFFPVRYTLVGRGLSKQYLAKLPHEVKDVKEWERNYFLLHTESHRPRLPDLMKLPRKEVLKQQFAPIMLATVMGLMYIPKENEEEILFGRVDKYGQVEDAVHSAMRISAKVRETAAESEARFGHKIPVETIALYALYLEQFREDVLYQVKELVRKRIKEDGLISSADDMLKDMAGHCFILTGKRQNDETYKFFLEKSKEAAELSQTLSDKSRM